jgi:NTP pyrophosphatase (non-canonical NTP hydrolase)
MAQNAFSCDIQGETRMNYLDEFLALVERQTFRKDLLYDGVQGSRSLDEMFRYAVEELGEVSGAVTRERWQLAVAECIDLAHCAFLIYRKLRADHEA